MQMNCPECDGKTRVRDSRRVEMVVARKRECIKCGYSFYTQEEEVDEPDALKYYWATTKARERMKK
jgi:transcriptional regulator NrdR family protein